MGRATAAGFETVAEVHGQIPSLLNLSPISEL
jgi:hypothetical protein